MPLPPLIPAIIGSIIESAAEQASQRPSAPLIPVGPSVGTLRTLPVNAQVGLMDPPLPGAVRINGQMLLTVPFTQFRDQSNVIVSPGVITTPVPVRYATDPYGNVVSVWLLTVAEFEASLQSR